jgi:hypothetical protein
MGKLARLSHQIRQGSLPEARIRAHKVFDALWLSHKMTRSEAYEWLCQVMNKTPEMGHIGLFSLEECDELIEKVKDHQNRALRTSRR